MMTLRPLASRIAALAILFVIVAIPCAAISAFTAALHQKQQDITERSAQLERLEAIARYEPPIKIGNGSEAAERLVAWSLAETDPGLAAATLQDKVRSLGQAHGVEITRAGHVPPETAEGVAYTGITLDMMGTPESLQAFLSSIDAAQPLLIVEQISLQAEAAGGDPRYDVIPLYATMEIRAALTRSTAGEAAP
jgi:hypothetical protein